MKEETFGQFKGWELRDGEYIAYFNTTPEVFERIKKMQSQSPYFPTKSNRYEGFEMCRCGEKPATTEAHSCPFACEIHGDCDEDCYCCEDCEQNCAWNI